MGYEEVSRSFELVGSLNNRGLERPPCLPTKEDGKERHFRFRFSTNYQGDGVTDREVIAVPASIQLHYPCVLAAHKGLHPGVSGLIIVDLGPRITGAEVVRLAIVMRHGMIVLDAVRQQQICCFSRYFPPRGDLIEEKANISFRRTFRVNSIAFVIPCPWEVCRKT